MSGSTTGRAPRSDPELARDLVQRVKRLEDSTSVRVGSWVLAEIDGVLTATKPGAVLRFDQLPAQVGTLVQKVSQAGAGTDLVNIAGFLEAFTAATGIDLLDVLSQVGAGGDTAALIEQITGFLTGWLAGIDVPPDITDPGPLVDWFNSQLPDNVIGEMIARAVAFATTVMNAFGIGVSDILKFIGWGSGGGLLGALGDAGTNLAPLANATVRTASTEGRPDDAQANMIDSLLVNGPVGAFITMISFGLITFWWSEEPGGGWSFMHVNEPPGSLGGAPSVNAVRALAGLLDNPTGSTAGPLAAQAFSVAAGKASQSVDAGTIGQLIGLVGPLLSGDLKDGADQLLAAYGLCDTRRATVGGAQSLAVNALGLASNPAGSSVGSLVEAGAAAVWNWINCQGFAGSGFSFSKNYTGLMDNPTGASDGGLLGVATRRSKNAAARAGDQYAPYVKILIEALQLTGDVNTPGTSAYYAADLVKTLLSNNARGAANIGKLIADLANQNILGFLGDWIFGGGGGTVGHIMTDLAGLYNVFGNPQGHPGGSVASRALAAATPSDTSWIGLLTSNLGSAANFFGTPVKASGGDGATLAGATAAKASQVIGLGDTTGTGLFGSLGSAGLDLFRYLGSPTDLGSGSPGSVNDPMQSLMEEFFGGFGAFLGGNDISSYGSSNPVLTSALSQLDNLVTSTNTVPVHQLAELHSNTGDNLIPDPGFATNSVDGQGLWLTDTNAMRTRRAGVITVYWVMGALAAAGVNPGLPAGDPKNLTKFATTANPGLHIDRALDPTYFEVVEVPYASALFGLNGAINKGTATLIAMINAAPGPFILVGGSQGAGVISNVYDEIRYGALRHRDADFLMGVAMANTRRQRGHSFPGCPALCPNGHGMWTQDLENSEARWWEFSVPAGTYPMAGGGTVTYTTDYISCLGDDEPAYWLRQIAAIAGAEPRPFDITSLMKLLTAPWEIVHVVQGAFELYQTLFTATTGHGDGWVKIAPMKATGADPADDRTFWQIAVDHMNSIAPTIVTELARGDMHEIECIPINVQPHQDVSAGASVEWINVAAAGEAIQVAVNVYDAAGLLIATVESADTTIVDPAAEAGWEPLLGTFPMPDLAVTAKLLLRAYPDAMRKGTVFFKNPALKAANRIDAAALDVANIPTVAPTSVGGAQGITDMGETLRHMLDGLASALGREAVENASFTMMFELMQLTAQTASTALALAEGLQVVSDPSYHPDLPVTYREPGDYVYNILSWGQVAGTIFDLIVCGAGGAGTIALIGGVAGGSPGSWYGLRLIYGVHIPVGTTQFKVHVGAPAAGGGGGLTKITLMDNTVLVSAAGGVFGGNRGNPDYGSGPGPGNFALTERPDDVKFGGVTVAQGHNPGSAPGGAGAGWSGWGVSSQPGAPGAAWLTMRKP